MGNQMCKERSASSPKSPIDRVLRCGKVMCPTPFNRKPQQKYWRKHVVTPKPNPERVNTKIKTKNTEEVGWNNATLSVPAQLEQTKPSNCSISIDTVDAIVPVPPPRKKRASTLQRDTRVKNGFKDVFGSDSRRHSLGDAVRESNVVTKIRIRPKSEFSVESIQSDDFADFSKEEHQAMVEDTKTGNKQNVSKVGNKKSDKVLGENLSDSLSDEPYYHTSSDDADTVVKMNIKESPDLNDFKKLPIYEKKTTKVDSVLSQVERPTSAEISHDVANEANSVTDGNTSRDSLDKKAEFLMTMLSNYHDDQKYHGIEPVEEPLIVPKRKVRKHICDNPDHFRKHEVDIEEMQERCDHSEILENTGPRKPDRDLNKYRQSLDDLDKEATFQLNEPVTLKEQQPTSILRPARQKRLSRENLPTPPDRPKRSNGEPTLVYGATGMVTSTPKQKKSSDAIEADAILLRNLETNKTIQRIISMPRFEQDVQVEATEKVEALLKKCNSSNSFLTQELMSELIKSKYGFDHWSEEYSSFNHDDGSNFAPTSTLKIRKISSSQRLSQDLNTPSPTISEHRPNFTHDQRTRFTIGSQEVVVSDSPKPPSNFVRHISFSNQLTAIPDKEEPNVKTTTNSSITVPQVSMKLSEVKTSPPLAARDPFETANKYLEAELLQNLVRHESPDIQNVIKDILENKESVIQEFKNYLEDELNSPEILEKIVAQQQEHNNKKPSGDETPNGSLLDTTLYQTALSNNTQEVKVNGHNLSDDSSDEADSTTLSDIDDCFDKEFQNLEASKPTSNDMLEKFRRRANGRRESIEDVDNWFTKHLQITSTAKTDDSLAENSEISDSDGTKLKSFPFERIVRHRRDSASTDFFENAFKTFPVNVTIDTSGVSVEKDKKVNEEKVVSEDHSKLLTIIKNNTNDVGANDRLI